MHPGPRMVAATVLLACLALCRIAPAVASPSVSARCAPVSGSTVSRALHAHVTFDSGYSQFSPDTRVAPGITWSQLVCAYTGSGNAGAILTSYHVSKPISLSTVEKVFSSEGRIKPYRGLGIPAAIQYVRGATPTMLAAQGKQLVEATGANTTSQLAVLTKLAFKLNR